MPPLLGGIHETILYAADIPRVAAFYASLLGLRAISAPDSDAAAFRVPTGDAVLLIFRPGYAATPNRGVPTHGSTGPGHVAFRVASGTLASWREHLNSQGVQIELERDWARGGSSIYFRDPAGNSVELVEGEIWEP